MPTQQDEKDLISLSQAPIEFIPQDLVSASEEETKENSLFLFKDQPAKKPKGPKEGIALCLSGGGYRAMIFHVGALWRLNELGYLPKLSRVSSVSGGSITAGTLGLAWKELSFNAQGISSKFVEKVVHPLRGLASVSIDAESVIVGALLPGVTVGERIASAYNKHLFHGKTLQDFPADPVEGPRFIINSTSVQSGALFRFSRPYAADWKVGRILNPKFEVALAVTASSAFPPVLSPIQIPLNESDFIPSSGDSLQFPPYTTEACLTDGGVYDNLGLETAWKEYSTILVSDGGAVFAPEEAPGTNWASHSYRIFGLVDNQVRSLRKRQLVSSYNLPVGHPLSRRGAYLGIGSDGSKDLPSGALPCPFQNTTELAEISTRLSALEERAQERLINWGYAICDMRMRTYVDSSLPSPARFPYPATRV